MLASQLLSWNKANCSLLAFDKENSIEFPLDLLHYIYNYYVAMLSNSHGLHAIYQLTSLPHAITMTYDFFLHNMTISVTAITPFLWLCDCHVIFSHTLP